MNFEMVLQLGDGGLLFAANMAAQRQLQQLARAVLHAHFPISLQHADDFYKEMNNIVIFIFIYRAHVSDC